MIHELPLTEAAAPIQQLELVENQWWLVEEVQGVCAAAGRPGLIVHEKKALKQNVTPRRSCDLGRDNFWEEEEEEETMDGASCNS